MASELEQLVKIVFRASDETVQGIGQAQQGIKSLKDSVKSTVDPLANFTKKLAGVNTAVLGMGAAFIGFAANESQQFQTNFSNIATLTNKQTENLGDLRAGLLDYATGSRKSLDDIVDATYNAVSAGVDYEDAIGSLNQAEKLSVAGKAGLNDSLKVLAQSMNSYGASTEDAEFFSSALLNAVRNGVTTLPELSGALGKVTSTAANAGVPFEELTSAVAGLTFSGLSTSESVTALRGLINGLVSPTEKAKQAFESLGIEYGVNELKTVGLSGKLAELREKTSGNSQAMFDLFGNVRALGAAQALTGNGFDKFNDTLQLTRSNTTATSDAFDKVKDSLDTGVSAFQVLLITVGDKFVQQFIDAKGALTDFKLAIIDNINQGGNLSDLLDFVADYATGLVDYIKDVVKALPEAFEIADFSGFIEGLESTKETVTELFDAFDLREPENLARIIETLGGLFRQLSEFTSAAIESLAPFISKIGEIAENFSSFDSGLVSTIGSLGGYAVAIQAVMPGLEGLGSVMLALAAGPTAVANVAAGVATLTRSLGTLTTVLGSGGAVATGLVGAAGALGFTLGDIANEATELATGSSLSTWLLDAIAPMENAELALNDFDAAMIRLRANSEKARQAEKERAEETRPNIEAAETMIAVLDNQNAANERMKETLGKQGLVLNEVTGAWEKQAEVIKDNKEKTDDVEKSFSGIVKVTDDMEYSFNNVNSAINEATGELIVFRDSANETTDTAKETANRVEDLKRQFGESGLISAKVALDIENLEKNAELSEDKIQELKVTLRQTEIQARVDLEISKLENNTEIAKARLDSLTEIRIAEIDLDIETIKQQTEQVKAAFESINDVSSTVGDNISTVIGAIAQLSDSDKLARDKLRIFRDQLKEDNRRFDRQLELQEKLVNAQVQELKARASRLRQGKALVTIEGKNLNSLEQLALEIIQELQFRLSDSAQQMLLGVGTV